MAVADNTDVRWWEAYLVRYLMGSVVGVFCVLWFLGGVAGYSVGAALKSYGGWFVLGVGLAGFAFSYLASMPIAVMHFGRYGSSRKEKIVRPFWVGTAVGLFFFFVLNGFFDIGKLVFFGFDLYFYLVMIAFVLFIPFFVFICNGWRYRESIIGQFLSFGFFFLVLGFCMMNVLYALSLPVLIVGVFQYVILGRIWSEEKYLHRFYMKLARARRKDGSKDIRDTYTHLREHSNSIFIVVLQISMFSLCVLLFKRDAAISSKFLNIFTLEKISILMAFAIFWLVPTLFMWAAANRLEKKFKECPGSFLSN